MAAGIIQLIAKGKEDMYLTDDPQITFFKKIYRRHTNFSQEHIPQFFNQKPSFGKKTYCRLGIDGDLVNDMWLVLTLPSIKINDPRKIGTEFAWCRHIGYALINKIEFEINGKIIDRHYGEWMHILSEMLYPKNKKMDILIGNVESMTSFSAQKDEYVLYIPLQFWFCKNHAQSLPLIALQLSDLKINLELNDLDTCSYLSPTHYITCTDNLVSFEKYALLEQTVSRQTVFRQTVSGQTVSGLFHHYDFRKKRLYYFSLTKDRFGGNDTIVDQNGFAATPADTGSIIYAQTKPKNVQILDGHILANHIFLDTEERMFFSKDKHDYLIEQVFSTPPAFVENISQSIKITSEHPCKFIVWGCSLTNLESKFNYTDRYIDGKSLVRNETFLINDKEGVSMRDAEYFSYIQQLNHLRTKLPTGLFLYSFSLFPTETQPSGTLNTSQIDSLKIRLQTVSQINKNNSLRFTAYAQCLNVLRITNGLGGVLFVN